MRDRCRSLLLIPILFGLTHARCGDSAPGSETGAGASIITGLPPEQQLSDFDDADAKTACEALLEGTSTLISDAELLRSQCAAKAVNSTAKVDITKSQVTLDIDKCQTAADSCQANPAKFGLDPKAARDSSHSDCDKAVANQQVMSCKATVAQYEACMNKIIAQAKQALASVTCANGAALIVSDGAEIKPNPQSIAECKLFQEQCPTVQITVTVGN
jgi:hypothetical protein